MKPKKPSAKLSQPKVDVATEPTPAPQAPAPIKGPDRVPYVGLLVVTLEGAPGDNQAIQSALARVAQLTRFSQDPGGATIGAIDTITIANMTGVEFINALRSLKG